MKEMREPACRAAQFSAFDALKGYSEMLDGIRREKERGEGAAERGSKERDDFPPPDFDEASEP